MIRRNRDVSRPNVNQTSSQFATRRTNNLKNRLAHAFRVMAPALFALTFASVAHAQGTMDFSGAQTLMGTFKTFAIYAGAVICFGGLIFAGIRMMSGRFQCVARTRLGRDERRCLSLRVCVDFLSEPSLRLMEEGEKGARGESDLIAGHKGSVLDACLAVA